MNHWMTNTMACHLLRRHGPGALVLGSRIQSQGLNRDGAGQCQGPGIYFLMKPRPRAHIKASSSLNLWYNFQWNHAALKISGERLNLYTVKWSPQSSSSFILNTGNLSLFFFLVRVVRGLSILSIFSNKILVYYSIVLVFNFIVFCSFHYYFLPSDCFGLILFFLF